jgi:cytochrome c oxidase subunit 2
MFAEVPLFPEAASTHASEVDALFSFLLTVSGFFAGLIAVLLMYFAARYRRRSESERPPAVHSSLKLELTWTLIPMALTVIMFLWGAKLFVSWATPPDDSVEVFVVAQQWMWKAQHMGGQREINQLHVPVGKPIKVTLISQDVIHSFFVPAFRIHRDVLPGRYLTVWFQATRPGTYDLFCSQYCGTNHAKMIGQIIVMEPEDFENWLDQNTDGSMATKGRQLFQKLQCVTCHSADATARAPVLEGLFDTDVALQGGKTVRADDTYLRESILYPDAKVVAGFQSIMPSYEGQVSEEEVLQLIAFIKTLGRGQTPQRNEKAEPPAVAPRQKKEQAK